MSATSYLSVGSLFSGVGGFDLGLERAGFHVVFQAEQDEFRRRVLTQRFPGRRVYSDVHDVGREAGHVGVLCGGFPCQDLSVAGRRAGLAGKRSGLFFEFMRVADDLVLPGGFVLIENVPGLLSSHGGRDFAVVLASLAELGFHDCAWRVLDSRYFGVPQRRRRVYILARRARGGVCSEVLLEPEGVRGHPETSWEARARAARASGGGAGGSRVAATLSRGSAAGPGVSVPGRRQEDDENIVDVASAAIGAGEFTGALTSMFGKRGSDLADAEAGWLVPDVADALGAMGTTGGHRLDFDSSGAYPVVANGIVGRYGKGTDSDATDTLIVGGDPESVRHAHTLTGEGFDASEDGTGRGTPLVVAAAGREVARGVVGGGSRDVEGRGCGEDVEQHGAGGHERGDGGDAGSGAPVDADGVRAAAELPGRVDGDPRPETGIAPSPACIHPDAVGRSGEALTPSQDAEGRVRLRDAGMGVIDDGTSYSLTTGLPPAVGPVDADAPGGDGSEQFTFDWQAGGHGDTSWRGKSRQWVADKPGVSRGLSNTKVPALYEPPPVTSFHAWAGNRAAGEVREDETNPITVKQGPPAIVGWEAVSVQGHHGQESPTLRTTYGKDWNGPDRPSGPLLVESAEAYALRGREDGVEVERTDLPNLRGHTGKDGGGHDGFVHIEPRVMDASSTHGHEGVGTGMPNMSAPGESLALTTRSDRYTVFGDLPEDLRVVPYDPAPDGRRYAAMGDAVTVNVIEWIGVRLRAALEAL